ncbi:hypothetical protein [Nocardioides nitrophenolicus]|uniref:hypothetical protein n=1 Tax=Nocardioides nitrophenolicus TaxID=60489 RepID=UPI00195A2DEA|nr:hypothetical protein [Nocardioides nitrophenolicus]MBM7518657.1 uncharacterized protein YjbI with pentapeptide repeats [Nocardioides nitrophenolicus]
MVLANQHLVEADFSGRHLTQFSAEGSRFDRCIFDRAVIDSASFGAGRIVSEYVGCRFDGAKLSMGAGGNARFVDCTFENTRIEHWFCFAVQLVGCTFSGRLAKAVFNGAVPADKQAIAGRRINEFEGNDFARAKLVDVSFRTGIDLTRQRLPIGDEYVYIDDAAAAVRRARIAYNEWNDPDAKKRARGVLAVMEEDVAAGQAQLLVRPDDYPRAARPAIRLLLEAARAF